MELQIQDLVTSIRKEGVDAANAEADAIVSEARKKAEAIVTEARTQAAAAKADAEKEITVMKESASISAEQARRDAVLAFKAAVQKEYEKLLKANIRKEMSGAALGKLIRAALAGEDASLYRAELSEVSEALKAELSEEIRNGLEIRPTRGVDAGFRLAAKDGSGYFDCTDDAVAEMMMPYFRNLEI